jgi:hypothetical protein
VLDQVDTGAGITAKQLAAKVTRRKDNHLTAGELTAWLVDEHEGPDVVLGVAGLPRAASGS